MQAVARLVAGVRNASGLRGAPCTDSLSICGRFLADPRSLDTLGELPKYLSLANLNQRAKYFSERAVGPGSGSDLVVNTKKYNQLAVFAVDNQRTTPTAMSTAKIVKSWRGKCGRGGRGGAGQDSGYTGQQRVQMMIFVTKCS